MPDIADLLAGSISRGRKELVALMRQKSTSELMLICIDKDRQTWQRDGYDADDAFEAARLVIRAERQNMLAMTDAVEEVKKVLDRRDPPIVRYCNRLARRTSKLVARFNWECKKMKQSMITKIKSAVDLRLCATVALGVFVALFAYRILTAAIAWSTLGWDGITEQQQATLHFVEIASLCAVTFFVAYAFIKRAKQARALRAAKDIEVKRQKYVQAVLESIHRLAKLNAFLEWMQDENTSLPLPAVLRDLSPDEVLDIHADVDTLKSMCLKTTEQLFDVVAADDWTEWTDDAIVRAAQELLDRQDSPDFAKDVDRFKKSLLFAT